MGAMLRDIVRGINGTPELNRVIGAFLGVCYGFGALGFTAWNMIEGREFDVVAFCTAFSGGAAILAGGTAGAIAVKDRNVASSKIIEQTGAVPTKATSGPQVPTGDPPPVHEAGAPAKPVAEEANL